MRQVWVNTMVNGKIVPLTEAQLMDHLNHSKEQFNNINNKLGGMESSINELRLVVIRLVACQVLIFALLVSTFGLALMDVAQITRLMATLGVPPEMVFAVATLISFGGVLVFGISTRYLFSNGYASIANMVELFKGALKKPPS